jgi:hypothetical protein
MYTKQRADVYEDQWDIYDPEDNCICTVYKEDAAEALLSHLNRG